MAHLIECSADEYHARAETSNSQISEFIKSPRVYHAKHIEKSIVQKSTKEMDLGSVVHKAVLESKQLADLVKVIPDRVLSKSGSKAGEKWEEFKAEHSNRILLKIEEFELVLGMFNAIYGNSLARRLLLSGGAAEATIIWEAEGVACRSRIDRLLPRFTVDLKSSDDPSPRAFEKSVINFRYHQQNAFYLDAAKQLDGESRTMLFVVVEREKPHRVAVHQLSAASVDSGRSAYRMALADIEKRRQSNNWADWFESQTNLVGLPMWFTEPPIGAKGNE